MVTDAKVTPPEAVSWTTDDEYQAFAVLCPGWRGCMSRRLAPAGLSLAVLTALLVLNVLPLLWGLLTSFKQSSHILAYPPAIFGFSRRCWPTMSACSRKALGTTCWSVWVTRWPR